MPLRKASTTSPSYSILSSLPAIVLTSLRPARRSRCRSPAARGDRSRFLTRQDDVRRLGALGAFTRLVLHLRVLGEGLEPVARDARVVHEEILPAVLRRDEAVPLRVVEPLHGPGCHRYSTSL